MKNIIEAIRKKWITKTFLTLVLIAIIILFSYLINYGVKKLNVSNIDISKDKMFSLTEESKNKIKTIQNDTAITCIGFGDNEVLFDFLGQYTKQNDKIKFNKVENLTARPDLQSKYDISSDQAVIVTEANDKSKILTQSDLYTYDNEYNQIDLTEEAITNAIFCVNREKQANVYFFTGHNMYDVKEYMYSIIGYIGNEGANVDYLDIIAKGSVPEECDLLVFTTLKEDISEFEKEEIIKYINNGGNILVLTDPCIDDKTFENMDTIISMYGLKIERNGIVIEENEEKNIQGMGDYILPDVNRNTPITKETKSQFKVCLIDACRLEIEDLETTEEKGVTITNLLNSTQTSFYRSDFQISEKGKTDSDEDPDGWVLGALAEKTISEEENKIVSKAIVISNNIFATSIPLEIATNTQVPAFYLYNNKDLMLNSVSYLTDNEDAITIRKNTSTISYTPTTTQNKIILGILTAYPISIIILGIIVWQLRRRDK